VTQFWEQDLDQDAVYEIDRLEQRNYKLVAENQRLKLQSKWQPIKTVPKGTAEHFDLMTTSGRYTECYWNHSGFWESLTFGRLEGVTHYMTIPEPPEEKTP